MATRNIVPRADGEGSIGTAAKAWNDANFRDIKVGGTSVVRLAGLIAASAPVYYRRDSRPTTSGQTNIVVYPTWLNINGSGYVLENSVTIDIDAVTNWDDADYAMAANRAGKDFYIYMCIPESGATPIIKLSASSTVPTSYTAANSRKIGGFHCLCLAVGTISGHELTDYATGAIIPGSVWDLRHRPVSESEGMAYHDGTGKWYDIYLPSWSDGKLVSVYGGVVADGASSKKFHGELFAEEFAKIGKRLIRRDEFIAIMKGSNEQTNIYGSADPNTTGGHRDTANRRMVSNFGYEDGCGAYWQWAADCYEAMSVSWTSPNPYMNGYSWQQRSVYDSAADSQGYGSAHGLLRRALLGGHWDNGAYCGSRCVNCDYFSSYVIGGISARATSEPRIFE